MIRIPDAQVPLAAALMRGRTLTDFPDDLAAFGALVQTDAGDVAELIAWLGPQITGPAEDELGYAAAKAFENERLAVAFVLSELRGGERVSLWPRVRFVYAPESRVQVIAPPQPRPMLALYLAVQTIGGTLAGMDRQLLEGVGLQPARPN